ncbi:hypothetical protein BO82DRAFT_397377 [Aspergillus uvarum CBS 121591]|uniref:Uncharacterized protein n=1 Tax=Aspergillus uvarum CBS 121591 TaxID=1448315 RepID=A0A319CQV9_9EURO|nr:hypothetical protein BO82DRAFT_397377 [Aspergillus uvarum CBS 121591]PYH86809.1 hypothetical protein BO82DRAFT_397377 [Aspergillus uvarum CBS 121591]
MSPTTEDLVDQVEPQPGPISPSHSWRVQTDLYDHHLVQFWRPEDLPPTAPPLAPGHYRLRCHCGSTETTVDWPEEQADAYHARFVRRLGYYQNNENG